MCAPGAIAADVVGSEGIHRDQNHSLWTSQRPVAAAVNRQSQHKETKSGEMTGRSAR
jgi:hypothetical protein